MPNTKHKVKTSNPKDAGRKAFKDFLAGGNRQLLLDKLQQKFGLDGVFAFGQAEFYYLKRKAA